MIDKTVKINKIQDDDMTWKNNNKWENEKYNDDKNKEIIKK